MSEQPRPYLPIHVATKAGRELTLLSTGHPADPLHFVAKDPAVNLVRGGVVPQLRAADGNVKHNWVDEVQWSPHGEPIFRGHDPMTHLPLVGSFVFSRDVQSSQIDFKVQTKEAVEHGAKASDGPSISTLNTAEGVAKRFVRLLEWAKVPLRPDDRFAYDERFDVMEVTTPLASQRCLQPDGSSRLRHPHDVLPVTQASEVIARYPGRLDAQFPIEKFSKRNVGDVAVSTDRFLRTAREHWEHYQREHHETRQQVPTLPGPEALASGQSKVQAVLARYSDLLRSEDMAGHDLGLGYNFDEDTLQVSYPVSTTFYPGDRRRVPAPRPMAEPVEAAQKRFPLVHGGEIDRPDGYVSVFAGLGIYNLAYPVVAPLAQDEKEIMAELRRFAENAQAVRADLEAQDRSRFHRYVPPSSLCGLLDPPEPHAHPQTGPAPVTQNELNLR